MGNALNAQPLYQTHSDLLALETSVIDARPGMVLLDQSIFFPVEAVSCLTGLCCNGTMAKRRSRA